MPKFACPICGDPNAFPIWIDDRPPLGCPHDEAWMEGAAPKVRSVTDCAYQRQKAWQAREFRRLGPECFDDRGNLKPGPETLARVVRAFHAAHPSRPLVI